MMLGPASRTGLRRRYLLADLDRIEHGAEGAGTAMNAVMAGARSFASSSKPTESLSRAGWAAADAADDQVVRHGRGEVVQYPEFMKNVIAPPGAGG